MPDIAMCQNEQCIKKTECFRYMAVPNQEWQSYMFFQNICTEENDYRWFWSLENISENQIKKLQIQEDNNETNNREQVSECNQPEISESSPEAEGLHTEINQ